MFSFCVFFFVCVRFCFVLGAWVLGGGRCGYYDGGPDDDDDDDDDDASCC